MAATGDLVASSELATIFKGAAKSRFFPSQLSCSGPKGK